MSSSSSYYFISSSLKKSGDLGIKTAYLSIPFRDPPQSPNFQGLGSDIFHVTDKSLIDSAISHFFYLASSINSSPQSLFWCINCSIYYWSIIADSFLLTIRYLAVGILCSLSTLNTSVLFQNIFYLPKSFIRNGFTLWIYFSILE